ncbi:hypothetical protein SAMN04488565_0386 [Leucobacter chromiiresistens]|uniref:YCII-related domain-containing protein n=1 Tax=Leucobacter chromiiresistens TaxID=1079994 RepID=A0A1H0Y098_9MICO|nr:hypothetical protein SAMN04488565_0386 [Leucobacter chromiiresistens]
MMDRNAYTDGVWVVQEDSTPDLKILAICATQEEALEFANVAQHRYIDGVIHGFYPFGFRHGE